MRDNHENAHGLNGTALSGFIESIWSVFARMKARQQGLGEPVSDLDLLIAATAKGHDLTVATLNIKDFSRIEGLAWENWGL